MITHYAWLLPVTSYSLIFHFTLIKSEGYCILGCIYFYMLVSFVVFYGFKVNLRHLINEINNNNNTSNFPVSKICNNILCYKTHTQWRISSFLKQKLIRIVS